MPEPFKNRFNPILIKEMARHLDKAGKGNFARAKFEKVASQDLESLELKERSQRIREGLEAALPDDFLKACSILVAALGPAGETEDLGFSITEEGIAGWAIMPMADYVAHNGQEHFRESLEVLRELTMRDTSEFAVRPFLAASPEEGLAVMREWARSENVHVRRLASEGSRPRLPWGIRLQVFDENPEPLLELLELLKDDPAEYVRRSVANSLNDIAKRHPERVAKVASEWLEGASKDRTRLVRHGCRTLIKQGHPATLAAFGFEKPELELAQFSLQPTSLCIGESLLMEIELKSLSQSVQSLCLDYAVHFVRASGKRTRKVFKWKTIELGGGASLSLQKKHSFRVVTTRVYYPGTHSIEVLVNGKSLGEREFELCS